MKLAAGVLLLAAGPADAITVSGLNPNASSYVISVDSLGTDYSGVAQLTIVRPDLGFGMFETCSGALLADGYSVLTAAHCIAGQNGTAEATTAYVRFSASSSALQSQLAKLDVDPLYDGTAESPHDIAVLTLTEPAPSGVARYELYEGDSTGQVVTLRVGQNQDDTSSGGWPADDDVLFAFDDGTTSHDPLGDFGLGAAEGFVAPGNAGGPSFLGGRIVGVHYFVARVLPEGSTYDIDKVLNSSFGEYAGGGRVALNAAFMQAMMVASPEPKAMFLIGIALVAVALLGDKRRRR